VESFNGRVRDELLNVEEVADLIDAQIVVEAWRVEYTIFRPHSALGWSHPPPTSTPRTGPINANKSGSRSSWTYLWGPLIAARAACPGLE
jgi:transposase InsO family protein